MTPIERSIASQRLCHVHWHVRKQIYSVKETGFPVYYVPELTMSDVVFHVDARLRAMFEANPKRRTVHATVRGRIHSATAHHLEGSRVLCNPFAFAGFRFANGQIASRADTLALHRDRRMVALSERSNP